ncbi:hypothetical protein GCM10009848_44680 [Micromonospora lupini]
MRGPLDNKRTNAGAGRGMCRGEPGGAGADDDEIPDDHRCSLGHLPPRGPGTPPCQPPDRVGIFGQAGGNRRVATVRAERTS